MTINIKDKTSQELYYEYNQLVEAMACKAQAKYWWGISRETAIQVGWEAFIRAKEDFKTAEDLGDKSNFNGFVGMRIYGAVIDEMRKNTIHRKMVDGKFISIPKKYVYFSNMEQEEIDNILHYTTPTEYVHIDKLLAPLKDELYQFIIRCIYQYDLPLKHIADCLNLSESRISQIHIKALSKLRFLHSDLDYREEFVDYAA